MFPGLPKKNLLSRGRLSVFIPAPSLWDGVRWNGVGYPSGQRGQTVNLLAYAFTGSNPVPTTTFFGPGCVHEGRDAFAGIPG